MVLAIFVGLLLILFMLGVAVPYALLATAFVGLVYSSKTGFEPIILMTVTQKFASGLNSFTLLAIPFFLLAGKLMNEGSITDRIFKLCNALVGWIPGGLAHANVLASVIFAGMSGSAVADAAGLGTIEIKAMEDQGFDVEFAAGITAASSTIGPIIPPSIPLIMYGVAGGTSIAGLLMGGVIPGVVCAVALSLMCVFFSIKRGYPRRKFPSGKEFWTLFKKGFLSLLTPVILIGGILSGIFTATEAASVASVYAIILTMIIYREVGIKELVNVCKSTCRETAAIMLVVASSVVYGYIITRMKVPAMMLQFFLNISSSRAVFLIWINIFLLFVGCFMDCNAAIMILTPILLPAATQFGIDPIHFGLIMVFNLMLGLLTPPVGMCLYATARTAGITFDRQLKGTAPFYIPMFLTLIVITYIPQIVLWLPSLMK